MFIVADVTPCTASTFVLTSSRIKSAAGHALISFFLTLKNPTKYTFYKDEVYGSLCNLLGEKKKSAGQKLVHFYELLNKHVIPTVESETALIESINKEIDAKGYVHNTPLIAQTALWYYARHVRNNDKTQIWLFLGGKQFEHDFVNTGLR